MGNAAGRNNRRYVRNNHHIRDNAAPYCAWCHQYVDTTLPTTDPLSWTTDHTLALAEGGDLYGERQLMHRRCNTEKELVRRGHNPPPNQTLNTTTDW